MDCITTRLEQFREIEDLVFFYRGRENFVELVAILDGELGAHIKEVTECDHHLCHCISFWNIYVTLAGDLRRAMNTRFFWTNFPFGSADLIPREDPALPAETSRGGSAARRKRPAAR